MEDPRNRSFFPLWTFSENPSIWIPGSSVTFGKSYTFCHSISGGKRCGGCACTVLPFIKAVLFRRNEWFRGRKHRRQSNHDIFSHNVDRSHAADPDKLGMIVPYVYSTLIISHMLGSHSQCTSRLLSSWKFDSSGHHKCECLRSTKSSIHQSRVVSTHWSWISDCVYLE